MVGHNMLDKVILFIQCYMVDIMMKVAFSADVTSLATVVAGCIRGLRVQVRSTSIGMPGGSACKGACITAGVTVVGACEWRNKKGVFSGTGYI
jgi:hypothetical protein